MTLDGDHFDQVESLYTDYSIGKITYAPGLMLLRISDLLNDL